MKYNPGYVRNILAHYVEIKSLPGSSSWPKEGPPQFLDLDLLADIDDGLDKIGDKKGAWLEFSNITCTNVANDDAKSTVSTFFEDNISRGNYKDLSYNQKIVAEFVRGNISPGDYRILYIDAIARRISNILNSPYHRGQINKITSGGAKMQNQKLERVEVQVEPAVMEKFDAIIDMPRSKILRQLIDAVAGMDKDSFEMAQRVSLVEDLPLSVLFRNALLSWLIRIDEHIILYEVAEKNDEMIVNFPEDFERNYRSTYRRDLERAACESIIQNKEAHGIPLEDWEKELLIKHHIGATWYESDEYKRACEQHQRLETLKAKSKISTMILGWGKNKGDDLVEQDRIAKAEKAEREKKPKPK